MLTEYWSWTSAKNKVLKFVSKIPHLTRIYHLFKVYIYMTKDYMQLLR